MSRLVEVGEVEGEGDQDDEDVEGSERDAHDVDEGDGHGDGGQAVAAVVDDHPQGGRVAGLACLLAIAVVEDLVSPPRR